MEIGLTNPSDDPLTFEVQILGDDPGLHGEDQLILAGRERKVYELEYAPAIVGVSTARSVLIGVYVVITRFATGLENLEI